ncbi:MULTISPECIES: lytic transglycosylase domain-containing protein [Methylobacterium]|uniref:Transglycosylase SLT domain-containing protein n=1 Tax=Methylobacterium longum TaxID=767694 RepID=A0ABT8ARG6_9HYPH|nr:MULTISPECIES: transglycosylase SLT domain-containing protein [Methylobacterium]MCJ2102190.1 transglycosylase SLT domain-containing protein [Methylobacterium sp. E-046]MDN3571934.1 transglycosylase SLT domain-containing protein [Methylobacterium longum]GJE10914.1 Endo-type membrane-bound lytic murein transglycosylase A [Methylobacterium longum]
MRVPCLLLLPLALAGPAQARPATFLAVHALGLAALPPVPPAAAPMPVTDARARFLPLIARAATGTGLPIAVADAVARIESGYDPAVVGSVGEVGLMQVRPSTAAMLGFRGTVAELAAPEVNVRYGVRYLTEAWRRADGDLCRALMKYRAGHGSEVMSPLSQLYCARAQAILADPELRSAPGSRSGPVRLAARASVPAHREPAPAAPAAPRSFWEAHRARIARLNAAVVTRWRARGWGADQAPAAPAADPAGG